jgi:hypothetical protein
MPWSHEELNRQKDPLLCLTFCRYEIYLNVAVKKMGNLE